MMEMKIIKMFGKIYPVVHETTLDYLVKMGTNEHLSFIPKKGNSDIEVKSLDEFINEYNGGN